MPISVVENQAQEVATREEFMVALETTIPGVDDYGDEIELIITTLHRDVEEEGYTHLLMNTVQGTPLFHVTTLGFDEVDALITYMRERFPATVYASLTLTHLNNLLMSVYGQEHSDQDLSHEIHTNVFKNSAYQGLISSIRMSGKSSGVLEISYTLAAEIFADTSSEESKLLKEQGLEPADYKTSSPNKQVPLFSIELHPLTTL